METISPLDWGPIYKETIYGRWPVEPWNTVTTFLFLIIVLYWAYQIRNQWQKHFIITVCLPIIFVGFVGGFLYHSCRDSRVWLIMDWGPIALAALACTAFYWRTLMDSWPKAIAITLFPIFLIVFVLKVMMPQNIYLSLGYPLLAFLVLLPLVLTLRHQATRHLRPLIYAFLCVVSAITLRFLDKSSLMEFLPMGSHFLWHIMGALTCYFFIEFNFKNPLPIKQVDNKTNT